MDKGRAKTKCFRFELPNKGKPFQGLANVSIGLRKALRQQDPQLELIENPISNKVDAYRVLKKGAAPGEDYLIHEFRLEIDPGWWLIDHLRFHDKFRRFAKGHFNVDTNFIRALDDHHRLEEEARDKDTQDLTDHLIKDLLFMARERKTISLSGR